MILSSIFAGGDHGKADPGHLPRVTPYLIVDDANAAIDFYVSVLGAEERMRCQVRTTGLATPS